MSKKQENFSAISGKKLGIMIAAGPERKNFEHAIQLAGAAARNGIEVYLYFIDEAVRGLPMPAISELQENKVRVFGCAFSLQRRRMRMEPSVTWVGLTMLNEIMISTDRFLAFT
ncbi:MAG: DsrE family protein [Verrucomicrobiales bacterium]